MILEHDSPEMKTEEREGNEYIYIYTPRQEMSKGVNEEVYILSLQINFIWHGLITTSSRYNFPKKSWMYFNFQDLWFPLFLCMPFCYNKNKER